MKKRSFRLSQEIHLPETSDLNLESNSECEEVQDIRKGVLFIMEDGCDAYLINPTIRRFLQFFQSPHDLGEAISHFAEEAKCDKSKIEPAIRDFFNAMCKRRILVYEDAKITNEETSESRFVKDQVIEHYKIEQRIFSNKKIEVYRALDLKKGTLVAIKTLKQNQISKRKRVISFAQEFYILKEIGPHVNICQFIDYFSDSEIAFGVLEYVEGQSLRSYLKKNNPDLETKLHLLRQFILGMAHIHRQGVLHGDLHMSNLLVKDDKQLKIIDFNMSNREEPQEHEVIREGGVHQYLAPEKIDNRAFKMVNAPADFQSEVYQMGVIVYFLLFEEMPFKGFSWRSLANDILHREATLYENTPQGEKINPELIQLLRRMLSKEANRRYKSAIHVLRKYKNIFRYQVQTIALNTH